LGAALQSALIGATAAAELASADAVVTGVRILTNAEVDHRAVGAGKKSSDLRVVRSADEIAIATQAPARRQILLDTLLTILRRAVRLAVDKSATLGGVLLTLRDVELRTVGFAIVPVRCTLKALVMRILARVAVSKEIFALQIELAVLDDNPLVTALPLGLALVVF
jgi:hypothetical protein